MDLPIYVIKWDSNPPRYLASTASGSPDAEGSHASWWREGINNARKFNSAADAYCFLESHAPGLLNNYYITVERVAL